MKIKAILPLTLAGVFAASTGSAQILATIDNIVDDVLEQANADFLTASVNAADIDGSIDISAGSDNTPGGSSSDSTTDSTSSIDETVSNAIDNTIIDTESGPGGSFDDTQFAIDNTVTNSITNTTDATTDSTTETFASVQQNFGDVSTVAAGAINDSTKNLTENAATAMVDIDTSTNSTQFAGVADNATGAGVGSIDTAVNLGFIDGSITMALNNANVGATSIGTVAAGSINTADVTAVFVGGSDAEASVDAP